MAFPHFFVFKDCIDRVGLRLGMGLGMVWEWKNSHG